jgi:putative heme-binding domain-containing protein
LQHAARQIASAETAQLVGYVRQRFASDIDVQFSLFESIRAGEQQRGGAPSQPIAEWAEALAKELLDSTEVNSPSLGPMTVARRRQGAAAIAAALALRELEPRLAGLLRQPAADSATRAAAARALVTLNPDVRVAALVAILGQPGIPDQLGLDVERLVLERDASAVDRLLTNAFQVLPAPHQWAMAKALANQASGAETLVELVERGHASPRLLTDETIRQSLTAVLPQAKSRIERLSSAVPPKRQSTDPLIVRHLNLHANAPRSTRQGADVFGRRCAACHQIAGKGFVIGPQLDGIGNRGLARIVEDIIDPSRNVDAAFRTTLVELDTGKVLTGLVRREDGATLVLADHEGKEFSVDTGHITKQSKLHVSLMPENLVDTLSEVEFHDLLAYLLTEHGPPASE